MTTGKRLIFVGGPPRSGTTLVQKILDSHPDIAGGPEFDRTPDIINLRNLLHESIAKGRISMFCSYQDVDNEIGSFLENLLIPFADNQNAKFLSEKTPKNVLAFIDLLEIFPEAHLIFVMRDPRAIVSSMLEVGKRAKRKGKTSPPFTKCIYQAANITETYISAGLKAVQKAPNRVLQVTYEDILSSPAEKTKEICNFLGIPWSEDMIYPSHGDHTMQANGVWYTRNMLNRNVDKSGLEKWKSQLSDVQKSFLAHWFKDIKQLGHHGYYCRVEEIPLVARLLGFSWLALVRKRNNFLDYLIHLGKEIPGIALIARNLIQVIKGRRKNI